MSIELKFRWFLGVIVLWILASFAGTLGQSLPREALFATSDGRGVGFCLNYNPDAVSSGTAEPTDYCSNDETFGAKLPKNTKSYPGKILLDATQGSDWVNVLTRPDFLLTVGLGSSAILLLYAFARGTGTLRAGLAAAISLVFLGILLFPLSFTTNIPEDMRTELVTAWQWVVIFYFGSEAAVQAWKISHKDENNDGDVIQQKQAEVE